MTQHKRVIDIVAKAKHYKRKVVEFVCTFKADKQAYHYRLVVSAGRHRASHSYDLWNLFPESRALIEALPRAKF